jgi:hypothetical protein
MSVKFAARALAAIACLTVPGWAQETREYVAPTTSKLNFYPISIQSQLSSTETAKSDFLTFSAKNTIVLTLSGDELEIPFGSTSSAGIHSGKIIVGGMTPSGNSPAITSGSLQLDSSQSNKARSAIEELNRRLAAATSDAEKDAILEEFLQKTSPIVQTESFEKVVRANVSYVVESSSPTFVNNFSNVLFNKLGGR